MNGLELEEVSVSAIYSKWPVHFLNIGCIFFFGLMFYIAYFMIDYHEIPFTW